MPNPSAGSSRGDSPRRRSPSRNRSSQGSRRPRRRKSGAKRKSGKASGGVNPLVYVGVGAGVVTAGIVTAIIMLSGGGKKEEPKSQETGPATANAGNVSAPGTAPPPGGGGVAANTPSSQPGASTTNPMPESQSTALKTEGNRTPAKPTPKPQAKLPLVLSNLRVRWESLKWKLTLDYEFQDGGPNAAAWYQFQITFPTSESIYWKERQGSTLAKKGTLEFSGSPASVRPVSGDVKIHVSQGRIKSRPEKTISAPIVTRFEIGPLKAVKSFTARALAVQLKNDDKTYDGKLIRVSGQLMQMKYQFLQLDSSSNRAVMCKLDGSYKDKIPLRQTVVVEGFIAFSTPKRIDLVGCRIVETRKSVYTGKIYTAKDIASGNPLIIAPLINKRFQVKGTVTRASGNMVELNGAPHGKITCTLSAAPAQPFKQGDVIIVEGLLEKSTQKTTSMVQCDIIPTKSSSPKAKK